MSTRQILIVMPPALNGASVYVDDVGSGHTVTATVGEFAEATARVDLVIGSDCRDAWTYISADADGYRPYTQHGVLIRAGVDRQVRIGVAPDPSRYGDTILPPLQPAVVTAPRALIGALRVVNYPSSKTHSFADDTGARRILFASWFCALRDYKNDPSRAEAVLDRFVEKGYQGIRMFRVLGESDTAGYFAGRAVLPEWSIEMFVRFAQACQVRGLRLQVSCGRQWDKDTRLAWEHRWFDAVRNAALSQTVALYEGDNEYWQNAPYRDSDEQIAIYGELFAMARSILTPAPLCACGAPQNEDPANLYRAATHSDILEKHGTRDEDKVVKRAFTPWYWEGDPGHFGKPMWEGEPVPPPGPDAFMPCHTPGRIVAALAMNTLVGNAVTFFCGEAVKGSDPTIAEGFDAVPQLLAYLPENVAQATHVPGGNIWWWQLPDGRFATAVDVQYWGPNALEPPRPIKRSTIIGPGWTTRDGGSRPTLLPGEGGALIVGEFA